MRRSGACAVGVPAGILAVTLAAVLVPSAARAQAAPAAPPPPAAQPAPASTRGPYFGGSVGIYGETAEGGSGQAPAGSIIAGYRFGTRWAVQGEYGWMGDVYCQQFTSASRGRYTDCHKDPIFNVDAVMRFNAGGLRPYLAFGMGVGVHAGAGVEIPIGRHLLVAPGVDVNVWADMLAARPKVAVLVRF